MERGVGAVIRISLPDTVTNEGSIQLVGKTFDGTHDVGNLAAAPKVQRNKNAALFAIIDKTDLPEAYRNATSPEVCR